MHCFTPCRPLIASTPLLCHSAFGVQEDTASLPGSMEGGNLRAGTDQDAESSVNSLLGPVLGKHTHWPTRHCLPTPLGWLCLWWTWGCCCPQRLQL